MLGLIVLFILLSPGFLLTIPAIGGRYFRTNKTSPTAVIVHGIIFGLIVYLVRKYYSRTFFEGFVDTGSMRNMTKPVSELEAALNAIKAALKTAEDKLKKMPASHTELTEALIKHKATLTTLQKDITNTNTKFNDLKNQIKTTINKINTIQVPGSSSSSFKKVTPGGSSSSFKRVTPGGSSSSFKKLVNSIAYTIPSTNKAASPASPTILKKMGSSSSYTLPQPMAPKDSYGEGIKNKLANLRVGA